MPTEPRRCAECGAPLIQRAKEKPGRFAARRFCSRPCAAAVGSRAASAKARANPRETIAIERNGYFMWDYPRKRRPLRPCGWCGAMMDKAPRVKCCSPSCGQKLARSQTS